MREARRAKNLKAKCVANATKYIIPINFEEHSSEGSVDLKCFGEIYFIYTHINSMKEQHLLVWFNSYVYCQDTPVSVKYIYHDQDIRFKLSNTRDKTPESFVRDGISL